MFVVVIVYIINSSSGQVVLFATTLNVGSAFVGALSSGGKLLGGVSSMGVNGSTSVGLNGSYGSFRSFSTIVHLAMFCLNFIFVSLLSGELFVNLIKKLSLLSDSLSTKV